MPKFKFFCAQCNDSFMKFVAKDKSSYPCPSCNTACDRQFPTTTSSEVTEVVDQYRNISWKDNQKELIKARREEHYWNVEVPRLVEKYSLQTCLEQGWLVYNDNKELVINKPPSKR